MKITIPAVLGICAAATMARAEPVLIGDFDACLRSQVAANQPVAACIVDAHAGCDQFPGDEPAALACYVQAKVEWGARIKALTDSFGDRSEEFRQMVLIEARYAISRNYMNCDHQLELALIGRDPEPHDTYARARCEAHASAVALVELMLRSGSLEPK